MKERYISFLLILCVTMIGCGSGSQGDRTDDSTSAVAEWVITENTPLSDLRVRQALLYALDMETIAATFFEGKVTPATSLTSPGGWLSPDITAYGYNPEKAKELLAEAQWPEDYVLDVVYHYGDQQTADFLAIVGQYWNQVGIKAKFRKLEGNIAVQFQSPPVDREVGPSGIQYDLGYGAIAALTEHEFYNRFRSDSPMNSGNPKQEGLDEMIDKSNATTDAEKQKAAFFDIQQIVSENILAMPLYHQKTFIYTSDALDVKNNAFGSDQYSYDKGILDWEISNVDGIMFSNGGPLEYFHDPSVNPGLFMYQELLFDRLLNANANLTPTDGMLAESYTVSKDNLKYTFKMRDDIKWHDGRPVTAEDVKFTYEIYLKIPAPNPVLSDSLSFIKGAREYIDGTADEISGIIVNGNEVIIKFDTLSATFLNVASQWPILPKHLLKDADPITFQQNQFWQKPVGSGPFKVKDVVMGNYVQLERWDGYYEDGTGNIQIIHMHANEENDPNLIKNAGGKKIDYAWSKSVADAKAIGEMEHMNIHEVPMKYTRMFYVNQYPQDAPINKQ